MSSLSVFDDFYDYIFTFVRPDLLERNSEDHKLHMQGQRASFVKSNPSKFVIWWHNEK